ncbi:glycine C-acetyltransferase [Pelagibius sp. Alg239-R121]|uniref:glycine C-acetyltransferase n=1 Tax=Pelagibius sp. Alg239-R121 TaxID=2993448 RepID=UPI0024A63F67|nr:glycine C-acetyltransferase [Pelagibius sp. Alg239-R121]
MSRSLMAHLEQETQSLVDKGLYKGERLITSPQGSVISVNAASAGSVPGQEAEVINLCANNYLGLSNDPAVVEAAKQALDSYGFGLSSVRFICGTQDIHKTLESRVSRFLGMEDTILFSSCFDANTGLFETLLGPEDAIISDALNHASIIDGVRLCKAKRLRYANNDMAALEDCLKQAQDCRFRMIATDGVFSMDGIIANLPAICDLAERYDALVMVDDSHAVGFVGDGGRGTPELCGVSERVDILTGTLGKALGGASGGYVASSSAIVNWLRQRSRPYLFSNSLAPMIVATSIKVLELLESDADSRKRLIANSRFFRRGMQELGFDLIPGEHPIIPVMLGDAKLAGEMSRMLYEDGVYVTGFSFPVVPEGKARIRTQMSAAHSEAQLAKAIDAFARAGRALNVIG